MEKEWPWNSAGWPAQGKWETARDKAKDRTVRACLLLLKSFGFMLKVMNFGCKVNKMEGEVPRRRYKIKGRFGFFLLRLREPFVWEKRTANREWGTEKAGMGSVQGGVAPIAQAEEWVWNRRRDSSSTMLGRSDDKSADNARIHVLLGQPRVHSTLAECQARKSIRDFLFQNHFLGQTLKNFFPKKSLPQKRMFLKGPRVNLYWNQHLPTPRG